MSSALTVTHLNVPTLIVPLCSNCYTVQHILGHICAIFNYIKITWSFSDENECVAVTLWIQLYNTFFGSVYWYACACVSRSKDLEQENCVAALRGAGLQAVVTEFLIANVEEIFNDSCPCSTGSQESKMPFRLTKNSFNANFVLKVMIMSFLLF